MSRLEHIQGVFNAIDSDKNGEIDCLEMICVLNRLKLPNEDVTKIVNRLDTNKDGFVNFEEFKELFSSIDLADLPALEKLKNIFRFRKDEVQPKQKGNLKKLFEKIDKNKNGTIEVAEFLEALENDSITRKNLTDLLRISQENNGILSLKDFDKVL